MVESERVGGMVQGGRLGFSEMDRVCRLVRLERKGEGMEEKLLLSREICSKEGRLEREGKGPERRLCWRERDLRRESWFNSGGNWPARDLEGKLMEVTRSVESQAMPVQSQGFAADQPEGAGVRDSASLVRMDASSSEEEEEAAVAILRRRNRSLIGCIFPCSSIVAVVVVV